MKAQKHENQDGVVIREIIKETMQEGVCYVNKADAIIMDDYSCFLEKRSQESVHEEDET